MGFKETYDRCLNTMFSLRRFGIKLELDTIRNILSGLGDPQQKMSFIHVAGTNGKGSIASALATILQLSGYTTGLYTSPHLVRFNERICINGRQISDQQVLAGFETVQKINAGTREPTFFEFTTAMAFNEFARQNVQWAVVETGMGGRMDATNVINPALAIITNVSLEHQMYLGDTLTAIMAEKAGIIKPSTPVVTGVKQPEAWAVLASTAASKSAPVYRFGEAFRVRRNPGGTFTYYGIEQVWQRLETGLTGRHQIDNAALTLAACEVLLQRGLNLPLEMIRQGLVTNRWPGRLEIVCRRPLVILDGAHNFMAARNLGRYLAENFAGRKVTLVIGILDDKPYISMLKSLTPLCQRVVITAPRIGRALPAATLETVVRPMVADTTVIPVVADAFTYAVKTAAPDEVVCVAGSLYVVGEVKELLESEQSPLAQNAAAAALQA